MEKRWEKMGKDEEVGKGLWLERKVGGKGNILERGIRAS